MDNIDTCSVCGGDLLGDGYTSVVHCENAEVGDDVEIDADVVECDADDIECWEGKGG